MANAEFNMSYISVIELFVFGLLGVYVCRKVLNVVLNNPLRMQPSGSRVGETTPSPKLPGVNPISGVIRSWLAPAGVMAVFVVLGGGPGKESGPTITTISHGTAGTSTAVQTSQSSPDLKSVSATHDRLIPVANSGTSGVLPGWVRDGNTSAGDVKRMVYSSQLWSTEAEARHELSALAAASVRADFEERHKGPLERVGRRFLTDERITNLAVKQQYVEHIEQDFGKFSAPMNRLWWQVEISPAVRTELYPAWKAAVTGNRAISVGAILALLTLAANSIALFFQLKPGSGRSVVYAASVVTVSAITWIGADLMLLKMLLQ